MSCWIYISQRKNRFVFSYSIIFQLWNGIGSWNPFPRKTRTDVIFIFNAINANALVVQYKDWWWSGNTRGYFSLQWRHNEHTGVSNHRRLDCLLIRLLRHRSKKTSKLCVTGLCEGNPQVTGGFPSQRAGNTENISISSRHHVPGDSSFGDWRVNSPTHGCSNPTSLPTVIII